MAAKWRPALLAPSGAPPQVTMYLSYPGCPPTITPSFQLSEKPLRRGLLFCITQNSLLESPNSDIMLIIADTFPVPGTVLSILLMLTYVKERASSYVAVGVEPGLEPR